MGGAQQPITSTFFIEMIMSVSYHPAMTDYRRNRVPGGTYVFTVNLYDRRRTFLVDHIALLRGAVRQVKLAAPFHIHAWVVLPDHLHCLWTLVSRG